MIKINLASKKQSTLAFDAADSKPSRFKFDFKFEQLKTSGLSRIALSVAGAAAVWFLLDSYKKDELEKMDQKITDLTTEQSRLNVEMEKVKGFELIKKTLEADESTIRTKIQTIQKLIADRQNSPKMLFTLASGIPGEVWLSDLKLGKEDVILKGHSVGYTQISDFMKMMMESAYFKDVRLLSTLISKDDTGAEVAQFDLAAKRR